MSKKTLRFGKIEIKKMPGLGNGLIPYENLSPHINIIAGPNASGKSSTARAIQKLLWHNGTDRITASGQFKIDDDSWISEVDSSYIRFQKDGSNTDLKGIPSEEERSRYMLSLHDLIREEESNLAESILKDAIGGYDIEEARNNLGYSESKKSTNTNQYKTFKETKETLEQITAKQKELQVEQNRIEDLEEEKEKSKKAKEQTVFYEQVQSFKEKQESLQDIREQLSEFPDNMESVKEDDYEKFDEYLDEIRLKGKAIEGFEINIEELKEKKSVLNLPETGVESLDLSKAENYLEELAEIEKVIREAKSEIAKAKSDLDEASKRLGLEINNNDFEGLDAEEISKTEQFWQNGFDLIGEKRELEKQVEKLKEQQDKAPDSETVVVGVSALSNWLIRYGSPVKPVSTVQFGLLLITALITAAAVQFFGAAGYIGILSVVIILLWIYKSQYTSKDLASSLEISNFEKTGLNGPVDWKAEAVANRLKELFGELKDAKHQEENRKEILNKQDELGDVNDDLETFKEEVEKLKESISAIPNFDAENVKDYSSIYWHLKNVLDWDSARTRIQAEESVIKEAEEKYQEWLDKLNPIFEKYGLDSVSNHADANASHKKLQELREQFNELNRKIEKAESEQKRAREDKEKAEINLQKICNRLEVTLEDSFQVKELVDDLEDYSSLKQKESTALVRLKDARTTLENHDLYEAEKDEIADLTIEDVTSRVEENKKEAEKLEEISKQINSTEALIKNTKQKRDLEQALQKKEEALLVLEEMYKENTGSIIGDLLVKHLKADLGEKNMPEVFDRAKSLFKRITKNRYELIVDSENVKAEFSATDMRDGVGRSLSELSSGTRIQLIMSVRLAFIEKAESEIKLPILADELLANSDTERASAIIDALIEISREGRQIFYFTAQEDEVGKWVGKLEEDPDIDYKIYSIGQNEDELHIQREPFDGIQLHKEVPLPKSMSYDEYGKALKVPPLRNVFSPVEQLHLWYLLDDTNLLHSLMKVGVENWGMLKSYFKEEGIIDGLNENEITRIEQRAEIIERYLEVLRHGESKFIDRQVLEKSGAITDSFIDDVSNKLEEVGFDPQKLLTALQNSEVSGFRNNKREELEEYLISNGYIQQNEPFSPKEIQTKMMAFISTKEITTEEAQTILDRLKQN